MATVAHAPDLVERDRELATLHALLADAAAGRGRVALIEGPAGIGKSRLLGELREAAARDGIPVLAARASKLEREFPFGVVRQLLEAPLAASAAPERLLAGAAAPAGPTFAAVGGKAANTGGDGGFAALHGLFWLTLNLAAERPLVLAVDDLHWCDAPSLRLLAYLVRRLEGLPVLVAVTVRASDPGTDAALLSELAHDPASETLRLGPLSPAGTGDLVRARLAGAEGRVLRRLPHGHPGQPAAPAPARPGGGGGAPRRRPRRRGARDRAERRLALAVSGATNREIAQALFVTPKTVEVHLSNAYRKLGIASRRDLPGVLAPQT